MSRTVPVRVVDEVDAVSKSMLAGGPRSRIAQVDVEELKKSIEALRQDIGAIFAQRDEGGFKLKSVEVGLEISAEGGVRLIGQLTAGITAGITLCFERT